MRITAVAAFLASIMLGCHGAKETTPAEPGSSAPNELAPKRYVSGTISTIYVDDGCAFVVLLEANAAKDGSGEQGILQPVGLERRYLKGGLRLRFTYRLSRAHNGGCTMGVPAILEDITIVK